MAVVDGFGLSLAVSVASASPHETMLVKATLEASFVEDKPEWLIGHRAYDSDPLDTQLKAEGIEMISPRRKGRKQPK